MMRFYWILLATLLVGACGGGGGSSNRAVGAVTDGNTAANTVSEDAEVGTEVGLTARATDPDGSAVTYSIVGESSFTINTTSGVVTVASSLDAETSVTESVSIRASSTDGTTSTNTFDITITNVNDNLPAFSGDSALQVPDGSTQGGGVTATDADIENTLTYSITGGTDQALLNINIDTGVLSFSSITDFASPADNNSDNAYEVEVTVSDGENETNQNFTIQIVDNAPPVVAILFPVSGLYPDETITVRGTVTDLDGDQVTVSVSGGGTVVEAVVTGDTWVAEDVPLIGTDNIATVSATATDTFSLQSSGSQQRTLDISVPLTNITKIQVVGDDLYMLTNGAKIIRENLSTGERTVVFTDGLRSGEDVEDNYFLGDFEVGADGSIYVSRFNEVLRISGTERLVLSSNEVGDGVSFTDSGFFLRQIVLDEARDRIIAVCANDIATRVFEVSLLTGGRLILSDENSVGEASGNVFSAGLNSSGTMVYVDDKDQNAVVGIDLVTGNRTTISSSVDPVVGSGPDFTFVQDIVVDETSNRIFATQSNTNVGGSVRLLEIDLATGNRTPIELGLDLFELDGIAMAGTEVLFAHTSSSEIISYNPSTQSESISTKYNTEERLNLVEPYSIIFGESDSIVFVSDNSTRSGSIERVDLVSGEVVSLTGRQEIAGVTASVRDIALDLPRNRILASSSGPNLVAVDLDNGVQTGFTGNDFGGGDPYPGETSSSTISISDSNGLVYFSAADVLYSGDLDSGNRGLMFDPNPFGKLYFTDRVLTYGLGFDYVVEANLTTGDTTVVSGSDDDGPSVPLYSSLVVSQNNDVSYLVGGWSIAEADLDTGDRAFVMTTFTQAPIIGRGAHLREMEDGVFSSGTNILWVIDEYTNSLTAVDVTSGDRVIFAK